jgi:hypothetical protein
MVDMTVVMVSLLLRFSCITSRKVQIVFFLQMAILGAALPGRQSKMILPFQK